MRLVLRPEETRTDFCRRIYNMQKKSQSTTQAQIKKKQNQFKKRIANKRQQKTKEKIIW